MRAAVIWVLAALLYAGFWFWYVGPGEPLNEEEIERYVAKLETSTPEPERLATMRAFLEKDDGREFFMVNLINMRASPLPVPGFGPEASADEVLERYTGAHMLWALLSRAGWFVVVGSAAAPNLEEWGVESAEEWRRAGVVRYRSRRDMAEIATDPAFADAHQYKFAAIEQTYAFPIAPAVSMLDPRAFAAAAVLALAAVLHLLFARRR